MKQISYLEAMALTTERMSDGGVFLSIGGDQPNTLTIGWGAIGYYWRRPVFTAVIRPQRFSYAPLLKEGKFTVSVPTKNPLKKELGFCGTKSGRDIDKFDGHGITAGKAQAFDAPIVNECGIHFECVVKLVQDMTTDRMDKEVIDSAYPAGDMHTMFFGEIVNCYTTDE